MADRTYFQIQILECASDEYAVIKDLLKFHGISSEDDYGPQMGEWCSREEIVLGTGNDIAVFLQENAPATSFRLWEDPKYEHLGSLHMYTPEYGLFQSDCDSAGRAVFTYLEIKEAVENKLDLDLFSGERWLNRFEELEAQLNETPPPAGPEGWYLTVHRSQHLPDGSIGEPLEPLIIGPLSEQRAKRELEEEEGTVYVLCTDDARKGGYIVDDVTASFHDNHPEGIPTPLYKKQPATRVATKNVEAPHPGPWYVVADDHRYGGEPMYLTALTNARGNTLAQCHREPQSVSDMATVQLLEELVRTDPDQDLYNLRVIKEPLEWDQAQPTHTPEVTEPHTILAAFEVYGRDAEDAQQRLLDGLDDVLDDDTTDMSAYWIAQDNRIDGSDCDSAVFVPYGAQADVGTLVDTWAKLHREDWRENGYPYVETDVSGLYFTDDARGWSADGTTPGGQLEIEAPTTATEVDQRWDVLRQAAVDAAARDLDGNVLDRAWVAPNGTLVDLFAKEGDDLVAMVVDRPEVTADQLREAAHQWADAKGVKAANIVTRREHTALTLPTGGSETAGPATNPERHQPPPESQQPSRGIGF